MKIKIDDNLPGHWIDETAEALVGKDAWKADLISPAALAANYKMHEGKAFEGLDPLVYAPGLIQVFGEFKCQDILDYGCGGGALAKYLDLPIYEFDICVKGKDADPTPRDLVVCFDVLEHAEPEYLDKILAHIVSKTKKVAHFVIANVPDEGKLLPDGRNPHLIVKPPEWWQWKLSQHFSFVRPELCIHYWARKFTAAKL